MWDLPGPGLEPVFPALAGGFLTTAPPGKSYKVLYQSYVFRIFSPSPGFTVPLAISLKEQKFYVLMKSNLSIFFWFGLFVFFI